MTDTGLRPDHEPGRDCPNAPYTCLICQPKVAAMIEYERLDVPGHTAGERRTMVDATVMFRFHGDHTGAAAVAEAESRLALLGGIDIVEMRSRRPIPDPPFDEDVRYLPGPATSEITRLAGGYSQRVMTALDLIDHGPPTATAEELLGLVKAALTGQRGA